MFCLPEENIGSQYQYQYQYLTRWAALMIQLGKFVGGGVVGWWRGGVADTNYLYPARWGWINYEHPYIDTIKMVLVAF